MRPLEKVLERLPDARRQGNGYVARCPAHDDRDPSLSVTEKKDGAVLVRCHAGCAQDAVIAALGIEPRDLFPQDDPPRRGDEKGQAVHDLLRGAIEDTGRLKAYLTSRGLDGVVPPSLRLVKSMPYFAAKGPKAVANYPGMVAAIRDVDGKVVGAHRTYLHPTEDGKAPVEDAKKWLATQPGATRGGAIRLFMPGGDTLALTEGIETGLAINQALGVPVWACLSAGNLEMVRLPEAVTKVQVWADRDPGGAGQTSGEKLARRLAAEGRRVELYLPPKDGQDWLDVLVEGGVTALELATPQPLVIKPSHVQREMIPPRERPASTAEPKSVLRRPELERAVIGTLLWTPKLYWNSGIDERDVSPGTHKAIMEEAITAAMTGEARVELTVLRERLLAKKVDVTLAWLGDLVRERIEIGFDDACARLLDLTMRREAHAVARELTSALVDQAQDMKEVLAKCSEGIITVARRRKDPGVIQAQQAVDAMWERLLTGETVPRLNTGWQSLDYVCGGLGPTDLVVLGGRTGTGKSTFMQQLCEQVAAQGKWTLICTPEMDREEVAQRAISRSSGIELSRIVSGFDTPDRVRLRTINTPSVSAGVWVYDDPAQTTRDIDTVARRIAATGPLALVVVDYVQFLANKPYKQENRQQLVGRMIRDLRRLAKAIKVPVVAGAQLGRDADKKLPQLKHLRESGDLEQDAVQVWFLYFPQKEVEDGCEVNVKVAKNRQGKVGTAVLRWNGALTRFEDPRDDDDRTTPQRDTRFSGDF